MGAPAGDAHGVNRWQAIFTQFRSAQELLARSGAKRVLTAGGDCAVDDNDPYICYHSFYGAYIGRSKTGGGWNTSDGEEPPPASVGG